MRWLFLFLAPLSTEATESMKSSVRANPAELTQAATGEQHPKFVETWAKLWCRKIVGEKHMGMSKCAKLRFGALFEVELATIQVVK